MGKFGAKQDSEGNEIQGDSGGARPQAGFVDNCEITYFGFAEDKQSGEKVDNRAVIILKQPNGAEVQRAFFKPNENPKLDMTVEQQIDRLNADVKHICTKVVDEETYHQKTEADSFEEFIKKVSELLKENAKGKKFRIAFTYDNEGYVKTRLFPNFIETMNVDRDNTTLHWNPPYDKMESPKNQTSEEPDTETQETGEADW